MLPPQSGHTQFRMLDRTSEPTIACISTSMNDKEASTDCPPASDRAHTGSLKSPTEMLCAFHVPKITKRDSGCFARIGNAVQLRRRRNCLRQHQRSIWQCAKSDSRLRSPAPWMFHSTAKAVLALCRNVALCRPHDGTGALVDRCGPVGTFALFCLRKIQLRTQNSRSGMPALNAMAGPAPGETLE